MTAELPLLSRKVCLVTGASRGIGKGIAVILAKAGATVYITGRTLDVTQGKIGSLQQTAEEVGQDSCSGQCIPVQCDHGNDDEVQKLFDKVSKEQNGRLDILVNNACTGWKAISENAEKPFYEQPLNVWEEVNNVGLRSNYIAAWHAARMMVPAKQGLIINVSSIGGLTYLFNVAYGIGKAANDRMAADMAVELRKENVASVSLWPGAVMTENVKDFLSNPQDEKSRKAAALFKDAEDPTFSGKAVAWLAADPSMMNKSGRILVTAELAREYGFKDFGGAQPLSFRQVKKLLSLRYPSVSWMIPEFVYVPRWLLAVASHKF
ncbi:dehydrogenase/reductase SDR family member 1-like [Porites lutea]|uniref:dehydrogenase/reductase SDR family member 1-like n=1 Tax=Porites lutea TaxID=51062 RepID=UPI003CC642D6